MYVDKKGKGKSSASKTAIDLFTNNNNNNNNNNIPNSKKFIQLCGSDQANGASLFVDRARNPHESGGAE